MKAESIPSFGPLQGVRVLHLTQSIAGPYCASRMADFGADVIWIESPKMTDPMRPLRWAAEIERRNMRSICLDTPSPEGKKIFFELLKTADIILDNFRGGHMAKWGLTDEVMFEVNPKLVILHISGYGQNGDPAFVRRGSYDPVSQAFSCYMIMNGFPDRDPVPAFPFTADYITALQSAFIATAALYRSKQTGVGESIDLSQFESMISVQGQQLGAYVNEGVVPEREGSRGSESAGYGPYTCMDGEAIYTILQGAKVLHKAAELFGLDWYETKLLEEDAWRAENNTPAGDMLEKAIKIFCSTRTAAEVDKIFGELGFPCSRVMSYKAALDHPHYKAREVFTEWENTGGQKVKGINIFPKLRNRPAQVWRGLMSIGEDTEDILTDLGYSGEQIAEYAKNGVALKTKKFE